MQRSQSGEEVGKERFRWNNQHVPEEGENLAQIKGS